MRRISRGLAAGLAFLVLASGLAAKPPSIKVAGLGLLRDREMRVSLAQLLNTDAVETLNANAIEDAAVILNSALNDEGFQQPLIDIEATLADGSVRRFRFDPTFATPVPRPLAATAVAFQVQPGVRWRVAHVEITGLTAIPTKAASAFFRTDATLLIVARTNAFSKGQLNRSQDALLSELRQRGFAEASVRAEVAHVDAHSGAVTVRVTVREGPRFRIASVVFNDGADDAVKLPEIAPWLQADWTPTIEQDIREWVRQAYYRAGHPDVGVHVAAEFGDVSQGERPVDVTVTIVAGPRVTMGQVRFQGSLQTRESVLRRRVKLSPGEPLNPLKLEHARYRLSRLGIFESVSLHYEPEEGPVRDPVFVLREGPRYETNLLMGYGSYEQLRGGIEYRQMNIFGLAHQSRLQLIQSMKSTRGEYTYTVPELFGETIDGSAKLFGLQRQEVAFLRQEYGATLGLRRPVARLHGEVRAGYTFQALRNQRNALATEAVDEKQVNVASIDLALTSDRRDNPLRPRHGYHWSAQAELASPDFGGAADYQRIELSGAYHTGWGSGRWIHVGFSHGVITTMGATDDTTLPVNKRFYPGGDNSIRSYQTGEAAPRGSDGRFIGAKSYVLLNLELEQALTTTWSVVVFGDVLGSAVTLRDYPYRERLYAVGLGLRYQTLIGPVRLEYGRNVNPRRDDPSGALQFSIGYPF